MNAVSPSLKFECQVLTAEFKDARDRDVSRLLEIRTHPISGRKCRITFSRSLECEPGTQILPPLPPEAESTHGCPFCPQQLEKMTPQLLPAIAKERRLKCGRSILFPNLYPYGAYSAVSLFDDQHFVEIGTARPDTYADSFINCARYLKKIAAYDSEASYMAITQNHLPAAGGSLVHPHLQVHADRAASNHHAFLMQRTSTYRQSTGRMLFSDYLQAEQRAALRMIGATGPWHWLAAFAPEGFFEIWAIYPGKTSIFELADADWQDLAQGVTNTQRFYRSLCRNSYNLGLLTVERAKSELELRVVFMVRANYAPWVRNDLTGYELMLGDMATFTAPEQTAKMAQPFWAS